MIREHGKIHEYEKFQGKIREFQTFDNISGNNQGIKYLLIYFIFYIL